MSSRKCKK